MPESVSGGLALLVMFVAFHIDAIAGAAIRDNLIDKDIRLPGDTFWAAFFALVARGLIAAMALSVLQYLL